jgi:hypothetical protein
MGRLVQCAVAALWRDGVRGAAPLRLVFLVILIGAALGGCATPGQRPGLIGRHIPKGRACTAEVYDHPPVGFDVADHMIVADSLGRFDPGAHGTGIDFAPSIAEEFETIMAAHARFRAEAPARPDRVLLFVNGGLNGLDYNVDRAREQMPCMMRDGYFPIFLAWRTGGADAYWEQVSRVRSGEEHKVPRWDMPFYVLADIGDGIARAPATYLTQFGRFLDSVISYSESTLQGKPLVESGVLNLQYEGPEDTASSLVMGGVAYAATSPFKLATIPFTVSFGRTAWENMIRRARVTIHQYAEYDPETRDLAAMRRYPKGTGAFSQFMAELERCVLREPSCLANDRGASLSGVELTVISHSLGSQIVEDLVSSYDDLPYRNIVHMGAASSIRHFLETLEPVLERRPDLRFYNLSLHPSADARQVSVYGLIPSGSLLEWIDDMYAHPATPLDRTMGKWLNDAAAEYAFAPDLHDRMVFRVFGFRPADPAAGDPGDPLAHSDFVETWMHYWLEDFWSLRPPAVAGSRRGRQLGSSSVSQ